jgi:hypothetical protein
MHRSILTAAAGMMTLATVTAQTGDVPYPDGYRDWRHVKSMVISQGHPLYETFGGIHHIYANDQAVKGYSSGRFPDGSTIVFDLLEAQTQGGATTEGARKLLGVMHKDSARWRETGGWGFEGFKGDSRTDRAVTEAAAKACFACHAAQQGRDYVFSSLR